MEARMDQDLLRYDRMVEEALRGVVREAIARVAQFGLPGGHALYVTFRTDQPGIVMPDFLRMEYPQVMTIVLEHQFWDLGVEGEGFTVALSFKGRRHRLEIPFAAVAAFHDPGVDFGLRFDRLMPAEAKGEGKADEGGMPAASANAPGRSGGAAGVPAAAPSGAGPKPKAEPAGPRVALAGEGAGRPPAEKAPDSTPAAPPTAPATAPSTAQVVSLDQFRKK
jgi:uncharacterized protein